MSNDLIRYLKVNRNHPTRRGIWLHRQLSHDRLHRPPTSLLLKCIPVVESPHHLLRWGPDPLERPITGWWAWHLLKLRPTTIRPGRLRWRQQQETAPHGQVIRPVRRQLNCGPDRSLWALRVPSEVTLRDPTSARLLRGFKCGRWVSFRLWATLFRRRNVLKATRVSVPVIRLPDRSYRRVHRLGIRSRPSARPCRRWPCPLRLSTANHRSPNRRTALRTWSSPPSLNPCPSVDPICPATRPKPAPYSGNLRKSHFDDAPLTVSILFPRRVRTLYACVGENETELTFEPNQIITNGKRSRDIVVANHD